MFGEELATRLAARGHDVTVYCRSRYSDPSRPAEYRGVKLVYLPHLPGKVLETPSHEAVAALHSLFRAFDIYYILGCRASWCYILHRLVGRRLVFQTDGLDWQRRKWGPLARTYLRLSYRFALTLASCVASDSRSICEYFLDHYRVHSEYLTCGGFVVPSAPQEILERYRIRPRDYFLVVCRIEPENNIDLIVRAFRELRTDKRLVVVGGANYASRYFETLKATKDPRVVFTGPVYEAGHVEALCLHAFAYVDGHEVGGTSPGLIRAMGCGACVLVLNKAFNAEVVDSAGLLWERSVEDLRAKMAFVLEHPDRAETYRRRAVERVAMHYSWESAVDAHERCFVRLTNSSFMPQRDVTPELQSPVANERASNNSPP